MKGFFIAVLGFLFVLLAIFIYSKYPVQNLFKDNYVPDLPGAQQDTSGLYGQWEWYYSSDSTGKQVVPKNPEQFILTFTPEGMLTSTTDCNTLSGSYIQNGNIISFGAFAITEKACLEETLESTYVTELSLVSQYSIDDKNETLILYLLNNSGTMVFRRR